MIDLHCHVLPGIDDGAGDLAEAVAMCRLAAADGCEAMVATPHQRHPYWWNTDGEELEDLRVRLQQAVGKRPRILPGAEIRIDSGILTEIDELPGGGLTPLAGSRYLLLELDRHGLGPDPAEVFHEILVAGWQPVLAHPELYPWLARERPLLERLVEMGVLLQVTAMSVTGAFGRSIQGIVGGLLDAGWVHFVASDAHDTARRPPGLAAAHRALAAGWGDGLATALTDDNPGAVVANRPLPSLVQA